MAKVKKTGNPKRPARSRSTSTGLRHLLRATMVQASGKAAAAGARAAAALKVVTFTCSNPSCLVGITSGPLNFAFQGSGAASFPVGNSPISFRVRGPARSVTITTQGGTLNPAIAGTPSFGGFTTLTVI